MFLIFARQHCIISHHQHIFHHHGMVYQLRNFAAVYVLRGVQLSLQPCSWYPPQMQKSCAHDEARRGSWKISKVLASCQTSNMLSLNGSTDSTSTWKSCTLHVMRYLITLERRHEDFQLSNVVYPSTDRHTYKCRLSASEITIPHLVGSSYMMPNFDHAALVMKRLLLLTSSIFQDISTSWFQFVIIRIGPSQTPAINQSHLPFLAIFSGLMSLDVEKIIIVCPWWEMMEVKEVYKRGDSFLELGMAFQGNI